ncbi:ATP-binding protein [Streptomyces sp. NBC_01565]|uniref:AAA family ATPase n=1 Tax=unclassified Streptomyces TaxID=2593676 RepID=UPI002258F464|nr:ATP-binding protein [Streptomyces sp. NBC_01565]MCX4546556.1 ATP-binding protein [Streptomyces sp. NBC_01565]
MSSTSTPDPDGAVTAAAQGGPEDEGDVRVLDLPRGALLVAVGPGASGNSSFAASFGNEVDVVVCLDELRREISGDPGDQAVTPAAVARQNLLLDRHLAAGSAVLVDSTNVESRVRARLLDLARRHGRPAVAVLFTTDLDTCLERNRRRPPNRRVPDGVLRWQQDLARSSTAPLLLAEGFTSVYEVASDSNPCLSPFCWPTGETMPDIRFAVVTDPARRHAYFWATPADNFEGLLVA